MCSILKTLVYLLPLLILACQAPGLKQESNQFINPTGTYIFNKKVDRSNIVTKEYFGDAQVLLLDSNRVIVNFYVNKGAPSFNSGTFYDTLTYTNHTARYIFEADSSCQVVLNFDVEGAQITQEAEDINYGCGFGQGVVVNAYYHKTTTDKPIFIDYLSGELY